MIQMWIFEMTWISNNTLSISGSVSVIQINNYLIIHPITFLKSLSLFLSVEGFHYLD